MENAVDEHDNSNDAHEPAFAAHNADENAHLDMDGATSTAAGKRGMVPQPKAGDQNKALFGDKTYKQVVQSINGITPDAGGGITLITSINMLTRNKQYQYGDIAYSNNLPSWAYLYCVQAGTTAASEPSFSGVNTMGQYITDGTVKWIVDDVRFNIPVGVVFYDSYLHPGCVKFNGATVNRADYIRPAKIASDYNLWTSNPSGEPYKYGQGNGSTTMQLPDFRNRFIEGGDSTLVRAPGLPNITGFFNFSFLNTNNGALYQASQQGGYTFLDYLDAAYKLGFDASRVNSIYGKSNTVQPPALVLIPQIKF